MSSGIILGLDPGFDRLGWAVATRSQRSIEVQALGCIQTITRQPLYVRYASLLTQLEAVLIQYLPTEVAIETLYFSKNVSTALPVSEARGVIISRLLREQLPIFDYNPMQVKLAVTGSGRADKSAIAKMLKLQLKLPRAPHLDDALDAVGICLTHALLHTKE